MKTEQQLTSEIQALEQEKIQVIENKLNQTIFTMFEEMTKKEILIKIKQMMQSSHLLKLEVKRLLIDNIVRK